MVIEEIGARSCEFQRVGFPASCIDHRNVCLTCSHDVAILDDLRNPAVRIQYSNCNTDEIHYEQQRGPTRRLSCISKSSASSPMQEQ